MRTENKGLIIVCAVVALAWGLERFIHAHVSISVPAGSPVPPDDDGVVVKVCRDGTLVLHKGDHFEIMRPDHNAGWLAANADVCMGRD
jgi:hypothetical protein